MSLNETVSAERVHIGFFGMRNAGKSSLVNAVTGQKLSVVSDVKGTTTDPVKKAMELLPLGPVVIIDTPGLDDEGELGEMRVEKAKQVLPKTDIAVLCVDASVGKTDKDNSLISAFEERNIPYIVAYNKADILKTREELPKNSIYVSAVSGENINELKEKIASLSPKKDAEKFLVSDLLSPGDTVVLVIPIDESAPKGRLILPQQQTIRDILEAGASAVCCRDTELQVTLKKLAEKPKMVITDSQVFGKVSKVVPQDVMLTSFSILFARYKGDLSELVKGAAKLSKLSDGARVLISEGCTHHRQCGDIGTVKMPAWIEKFTGVKPDYTFTSGGDYPANLGDFDIIVHCGGCTLNEAEMQYRIRAARDAGTPIVNYGVAIAHMHGILRRSLSPFPDISAMLEDC
ncbi:MAG: [Clostridia bacterium]|nr:[FeFe] hydrogenase H-cluster maturation GTPase HydF [Clostridia bacterium]